MDVSRMCRVCLQKPATSRLVSIFSQCRGLLAESRIVSDMLTVCTNTRVFKNDNLPQHICKKCINELRIAYNFKVRCEESYIYMLSLSEDITTVKVEKESDIKDEDDNVNSGFNHEDTVIEKVEKLENKDVLKIENEDKLTEVTLRTIIANETDYKTTAEFNIEPVFEEKFFLSNIVKDGHNEPRKHKRKRKFKDNTTNQVNHKTTKVKKKKERVVTDGTGIQCKFCPVAFRYQYQLNEHEKSHWSTKNYYCKMCDKYYTSEFLHKKYHLNSNKFVCDTCNKAFSTKQKISNHILWVHGQPREKKFKCDVEGCNKSYVALAGFQRHKLIHEGTKNFLCHLCSNSYFEKAGLNIHIIHKHTKVRKYKCNICLKGFHTSNARNVHQKKHSNIKPHKCDICEKRFFDKSHLRRHVDTHVQDLKYDCRFCAKRFLRTDARKRHETCSHGVNDVNVDDNGENIE